MRLIFSSLPASVLSIVVAAALLLGGSALDVVVGQEAAPALSARPADKPASPAVVDEIAEPPKNDLPAGHSMHGEAFNDGPRQAAYLMGGTGKVHLSISTKSPVVQLLFDQGLGQLHGFWYWEAERSFRQAAAVDPECAMAYWGMAMANVNNSDRALKFSREAAKRNTDTTRHESLYIDALSAYYEDWDKAKSANAATAAAEPSRPAEQASGEDKPEPTRKGRGRRGRRGADNDPKKAAEKRRKQEYLQKLEAITKEFPADLEAKAFLAYYRWSWKDDVPIEDRESVDALLSQVFQSEPMHPAHHYRIHLWDDPKPERALTSAAAGGRSAPSIAHMWHMPGHIYSKLHRYQDAVYQQEASARVDHAYMSRDRIIPYRIHNYAHNNEWLVRNLVHVGRVRDAVHVAQNLIEVPRHPKLNSPTSSGNAALFGRERLFDTLVLYELWNDYIRLAETAYLDPGDSDREQVRRIRWLGAAHLAVGNRIQGGEQLALLEGRLAKLKTEQDGAGKTAEAKAREEQKPDAEVQKARDDARKAFDERAKAIEKAIGHLHGLQAAATGDHQTAVGLFEQAGDISKPHLARAYLRAGDREKAKKLAREAVDSGKNQVYALATYVEVLYAIGQQDEVKADEAKPDEAKQAFEQLRALASVSDLKAPVFDRLADIAPALGYTSQWRLPATEAADVGVRPPLESLGPFRWEPTPAVTWTLANAEGEPVSIYDYAGKPVIVIFYLGYGCLHCVEQLQKFAPLAKDFNEAGIELVAISTDSIEDLKKSIEAYQGSGFGVQPATSSARLSSPKSVESGSGDVAKRAGAFPFTLLSNGDLRLFKAYGCFDDFEQQPLHGTFLIDKGGLVRWQETGAEPFKDAAFLLQETKRLIALPRR
ncbi:MAG: redoxin domain-containing protein [Pirellulales bacterium]